MKKIVLILSMFATGNGWRPDPEKISWYLRASRNV